MSVSDQRRRKRFDLRLPVELVRWGSQPMNEAAETMNMSSGGVLFASDVDLEVGTPIEYIVTLQGGTNAKTSIRLHCVGKVVRKQRGALPGAKDEFVATAATLERYEFVRPLAK